MRVGFVGMGKLGLPLAVATAAQGFQVGGWDVVPALRRHRKYEHREGGYKGRPFQSIFDEVVREGDLFFAQSLEHLAGWADLLFVVVQTPHDPEFEGVTRLPVARRDFDYTALRSAVLQLADLVRRDQVVVVMSTVLPGTSRRELLPALRGRCPLVYNPAFPAMGTVLKDFLEPEFVLLGGDDGRALEKVATHYDYLLRQDNPHRTTAPIVKMHLESAELCKVAYNTFVSMKIGVANTLMEVCHKTPGADVDEVTGCLRLAHRRVCGPQYMDGGQGDGGACLTGGTKISLLDGREVPIRSLVGLSEFYVYAYDLASQRVVPGRAHSCRLTKKNAPIYEVMLDNGRKIRCTGDHPFLLRDGSYKDAEFLRSGDRLMPLYRRLGQEGYEQTLHPISGGWEHTHRLVYRWKYGQNSSQPTHAHHKDLRKQNNDPANIEALDSRSHSILHNGLPERREAQSELMSRLNREGKTNGPEQRKRTRLRNLTDNPMTDATAREKNSVTNGRIQRQMVADGIHHLVTDNPSPRRVAEGVHNFVTDHPMHDEETKRRMIASLNDYNARRRGFVSHEESVRVIRRMHFAEGMTVAAIKRELGLPRGFINSRLRGGANHTVESVRFVGRRDVYNFEVDQYHNYATSAGVFIHNCHPRDNIAMSWLANQLDLSADLFGAVMAARELQAQWLVNLMLKYRGELPLVILGKAYKPETNLTTGSAALLVANLLAERAPFTIWDPYVDPDTLSPLAGPPACFLVATKHERFARGPYPDGSVVIDPFRFVEDQLGVQVVRVGVGPTPQTQPYEQPKEAA